MRWRGEIKRRKLKRSGCLSGCVWKSGGRGDRTDHFQARGADEVANAVQNHGEEIAEERQDQTPYEQTSM